MNSTHRSELTFQIQEGRGDSPIVREALVQRFAPDLFNLAVDLHPDSPDRLDNALGITAETFRRALADHRKLREYDSIRNWLSATLIGIMGKAIHRNRDLGRKISPARRLALVLRYGHDLSIDDIAEVMGTVTPSAHRHLRRGRRQIAGIRRPVRAGHIARAIDEAVDGRIKWTEILDNGHLENCESCRIYLGSLQEFGRSFTVLLAEQRPPAIQPDAVQAILEHLDRDQGGPGLRSRGLPVREAAWAAGAVVVFLLIFQMLNPILAIEPPEPLPTPTIQPPDPASSNLQTPSYALLEERLTVWEAWTRWEPANTISGNFPSTTEIVFSESAWYAAFGSFTDVVLWNLAQEIEIPLEGHESVITSLAFGGDRWLATGSEDGIVRVWDVGDERARFILEGGPRPVSTVAFSPDLGFLAAAGNSGITIWKFSENAMLEIEHLEGGFIRNLAFSPGGDLFASVDRSGAINIWNLPGFTHRLRFAARQRFNTAMAFSPGGNRIATASMDGTVKVFHLSVTGQDSMSAAHILTLSHPTWVSDLAWIGDQLLFAVAGSYESSISNLGKRGVYLWELASGLPAALPLFLEDDGGVMSLRLVGPDKLHLGSYNRAVHVLRLEPPIFSGDLEAFSRSGSGLLPAGRLLSSGPDPFGQSYRLDFQSVLEEIGYAQAMTHVLTEAIPAAFVPQGAAFDYVSGIATFAFTRSFALDHEEWTYLRIRRIDESNPYPFREDWVGLGARVELIQIGRYAGERVSGEWLPAAVDGGAEGILRWTDSPLTRFRWIQDGYLIEIVSRSEIGTEISRWNSLFQPIALALISADRESQLIEYRVVDGDTCTGIADRFGTTIGRIVSLNTLDVDCTILSGQILQLPLPPAFGPVIEADFDCDGVQERLRSIPDPRRSNSELFIGFILEDIPGTSLSSAGSDDVAFDYAAYWTYSVPDVDVDFFESPIVFTGTNHCPGLIGITGFGGSGMDSGLRIFSWTGEEIDLVLAAEGFLTHVFEESNPLSFQTRALEYDPLSRACTETITTYEWREAGFIVTYEVITTGLECFNGAP